MIAAALVYLEAFSQILMRYNQKKHSVSDAKKVPNKCAFTQSGPLMFGCFFLDLFHIHV